MRESEYRKHQEGNWTVFDVTPAEEPKFMLMVVGGAVLVVFFFWMILTIPVGIWAFWKGWSGKIRPKEHT